jgi:hypothetical protein
MSQYISPTAATDNTSTNHAIAKISSVLQRISRVSRAKDAESEQHGPQ